MDYLSFLFAILHVYKALSEEIFWDTTVKLAKNMTLECVYSSMDTLSQMEWFKINTTEKQSIAIFSPTLGVNIREPYADRVYFSNSTMASNDMTLSFHNASEADVGFYSCFLHTFPSGFWKKVIRVVQSDSFEIPVSPNNHVVSEPGKNVTLTYWPQMKWLMGQVTWEKIQPHQIDLLALCNLSQGRSYSPKYQRQVLTNCSQGLGWSFVVLPHVTVADSGLYRCCFKARTGENETFVMRLTVTEGKTNNQYTLFLAGGIVSVLLLAILIYIVIHCNSQPTTTEVPSRPIDTWKAQERIFMSTILPSPVDQRLNPKLFP
ncbi:CD226 antigen isoform X2 [Choloepus didactylus]|uniref:CD226 antigen isoform X2 n=2 Tax=Choloepus didactylus TaxID=27675 RepID=UPI0018A0CE5E|nr:CD226 antigen isoform X2 [Choloepus didactylus]XP_037662164.1 CD226 antigen isoform X2 [Choloepus didactylus]